MCEIHLRQPRLTYSACGTFTKNKERIQKFKEARDSWHVYQNKLDKACLTWYGNAYESFEDLPRRTASDVKSENMLNQELAEELHKPIIGKL